MTAAAHPSPRSPAVIVLPPDVWWLLRLDVKPGESTPFHLLMLWHHQWLVERPGVEQ